MNVTRKINEMKEIAINDIKKCAQSGNYSRIQRLAAIIEELDAASNSLASLRRKLESLEGALSTDKSSGAQAPAQKLGNFEDDDSDDVRHRNSQYNEDSHRLGREKAAVARRNFIQSVKEATGTQVVRKSGNSIYTTSKLRNIGIAFSTERESDRFFLGLTTIDYDCFVLICERNDGVVLEFVFDAGFFNSIKRDLSRSGNQSKFNIKIKNASYYLNIPNQGDIPIDSYHKNYRALA